MKGCAVPTGVFFSNSPPANYWQIMAEDLCAALSRSGCPMDIVSPDRLEAVVPLLQDAAARSPAFAACFNFRISWISELCAAMNRIVFPHEYFAVPAVNILLDHPVHEAGTITLFEEFSRKRAIPALYGIMDQDHLEFMADFGVPADRVFLFPQGGPPPVSAAIPMAQRSMGCIFHGGIDDLESDDAFFARIGVTNPAARGMMEEVIADVLADRVDPYGGAKAALGRLGYNAPLAAAQMAVDVDRRARRLRRWRVLCSLSDVEIHYCGTVCPAFQRQNPNGIYHGPLSFAEVSDWVANSKIVLNDTINLRHSALMRLHYAMAAGTVVASQPNAGLSQSFTDGRDILFLAQDGTDGARLKSLLSDPAALQTLSDQATANHAAHHLWDHRVQAMTVRPWA